jgi:mannonate dehydratase
MIRIAAIPLPFTDERLRLLKQAGVDDALYYDMAGFPEDEDELRRIKGRIEAAGLRWSLVEGGPAIDRIVLGKPGWREQLVDYRRAIGRLGRLGIETLCYNFMPQITADAMVVRTDFAHTTRGGAVTSRYRAADYRPEMTPHHEAPSDDAAMWKNLERFLAEVVPAAEDAGVKLAMHPDDPPVSPMAGLARIMRSPESYERLFNLQPSPVNGMTFCLGCFLEMPCDLVAAARRFAGRIHFVHFRDVGGGPGDFWETFPDDGPTDFAPVFRALAETNFDGCIRVDHVPAMAGEVESSPGYGMMGHLFAIGYLRGVLQTALGKK